MNRAAMLDGMRAVAIREAGERGRSIIEPHSHFGLVKNDLETPGLSGMDRWEAEWDTERIETSDRLR